MKGILSLILLFLTPSIAFSQLEQEPNDKCELANKITIGSLISGDSDFDVDIDYYRFELTKAGLFRLYIKSLDISSFCSFGLYKDDCIQSFLGSSTENEPEWKRDFIFLEKGIYILQVRPKFSVGVNSTYEIKLELNPEDPYEANNSIETAAEIFINETHSAKFFGTTLDSKSNFHGLGKDKEFFKVEINKKGILMFSLDNSNIPLENYLIYIYDVNHKIIACLCCGFINSSPAFLEGIVCDPGFYTIEITFCNRETIEGAQCDFHMEFIEDPTECNNATNSAIQIEQGQSIHGYLGGSYNYQTDIDYYKFSVDEPRIFNVEDWRMVSGTYFSFILTTPYNELINYWYNGEFYTSQNERILCDKGNYYIRLSGENIICSPANDLIRYSFRLNLLKPDEYECNNSFDEAYKLNQNQPIIIYQDARKDEDFFRIEGQKGDSIQLDFTIEQISNPIQVSLFDDQKRILRAFNLYIDDIQDINYFISITTEFLYLKISYFSNNRELKEPINFKYQIKKTTSIEKLTLNQVHGEYNMTDDKFNLYFNEISDDVDVEIYDLCGRRLIKSLLVNSHFETFDFSNYSPAIYFVKVKSGSSSRVFSIAKQ